MFSNLIELSSLRLFKKSKGLGSLPQAHCATDLDGDGDQDIVMTFLDYPTGSVLTSLRLWENVNGVFVPRNTAVTNQNILSFPGRVFSADFNLDGKKDIYVGTFGNELIAPQGLTAKDVVFLNEGGFNFRVDSSANFPLSWAHGSRIGDINNDGRTDIFSSGMAYWPSYFFLNENTWNVIDAGYTGPVPKRGHVEDSYIADIDADGYSDLVIGTWSQNTKSSSSSIVLFPAQVYWGAKNGISTSKTDLPFVQRLSQWDTTTFATAVGDINGDTLPDIVLAHTNDGSVVLGGTFFPEWEADLNRIPRAQTATANATQILINNGDRTFTDITARSPELQNTLSSPFFNLRLIDFNQDGYLDIFGGVLSYQQGGPSFIYINDGNGKFTALSITSNLSLSSGAIYTPFPIDVNNDGAVDIATMQLTSGPSGELFDTVRAIVNTTKVSGPIFGSAEDDQIKLTRSGAYYGNSGDDWISGSNGNDIISGGPGNDLIDGNLGIDTVVFTGNRANFTITKTTTGFTVKANTGAEGADTLTNIERLQFFDKTIAFDINGTAGQAYRVYQAAFNRTPDNGGLKYWIGLMDGGYTLAGVASGFIASAEFKTLYGSNPTNELFVSKLYDNVLHRTPDAGGYNYWVGLLNTNKIDNISTLINFSESTENQAGVIGVIQNGIDLLN